MTWTFVALVVGVVIASILEICIGPMGIPIRQIVPDTIAYVTGQHSTDALVVGAIRLPRLLVALLVGAALATTGAVLQAVFKNPMSDPGVIGVSSGSAMGAILTIQLGISATRLWARPVGAFICGIGVVVLIYRLATVRQRTNLYALLLAGVAVSSLCSAIITLILSLSPLQTMEEMLFWLMGGLDGSSWSEVLLLAVFVFASLVVFLIIGWALDIMLTGEEHAEGVGVPVQRIKQLSLGICALLVAVCVSTTGVISFVGLIVPHLLRGFVGSTHRYLIPASALGGAILLSLSDLVARMAFSPVELNVGIVTACLGAPFFLYLLFQRQRAWQRS
ncbi:hemin ABC transporter permease [Alicyclobacillus acidoterrestris]|uniref:FecCD family ABC transporter permease n=1 Tax=Alicyclobacillus suci TaxID=2816080 RepID=UPI001194CF0E|nr:iron ABC transporter permease [Alicyclobacillus suci]GEO27369.1 hemin ABC transporter permease [Alicyclobacillus acidoterrestris]